MFIRSLMMDLLQECANCFKLLLDTRYNITLGRKGKLINICLAFDKANFHHLIGLKYLTDMPQLNQDRARVFDKIINGEFTYGQISRSEHFSFIADRLSLFIHIENFLDNNDLIFKYNRRNNPASRIEAEYFLVNVMDNNDVYLFIDKAVNSGMFFCRSFFPRKDLDFKKGQASYTLLYKEKVNAATRTKTIQYDKLTPKKENEIKPFT